MENKDFFLHSLDNHYKTPARNHELLNEKDIGFRDLANALPHIIWTAKPDFTIEWYNDWGYRYLEVPKGTQWGDPLLKPVHPEDIPTTQKAINECLAKKKELNIELRFRRGKDGMYRWHVARGRPLFNSKGDIVKWVGGNTDIHEIKEESELKDKFVYTITHDLRTPLTAARMNADFIKKKIRDEKILTSLFRITDNLNRTFKMIDDILDADKIRAGKALVSDFKKINVTEIIANTLEDLMAIHGDRFIFKQTDELMAWLCPYSLRRILENLCTNAIKYGSPHDPVLIDLKKDHNHFFLCVQNKINPDFNINSENLFKPFQRGVDAEKKGERGWGIGLTIVKGLTEAHNGVVYVEKNESTTTFKIKFPLDARQKTCGI